jgi:hypothetical protein
MARLVWRYPPQDHDTAHLVYAGHPQAGREYGGLALVSTCGLATVGMPDRWKGGTAAEARHLGGIRRCPVCAAKFPEAAAPQPA